MGDRVKREVAQLPVLAPVQKTGGKRPYEIRWQTADGWAVGDCYKGSEYRGRYVIDRKGRHGLLKGRKREQATLAYILGGQEERYMYYWSGYFASKIICIKDEEQAVRELLDPFGNYAWKQRGTDIVISLEESFNRQERQNAAERKQYRIDEMMLDVPMLPDDLQDWLKEKVWPNDYLFPSDAEYDTEDEHGKAFYCTACGKLHRYRKPPKLAEAVTCPETGRQLIRKRKGSKISDYERVMVLQRIDDVRSVARHLKAERKLEEGYLEYWFEEEIRIMLYRQPPVFRPFDRASRDKVYYGQKEHADELYQEWSDHNPWNRHMHACWCYPAGIREALAGTAYQKAPVAKMAEAGWKLNYNQVMLSVITGNLPEVLECMTAMKLKKLVRHIADYQISYGRYYGSQLHLSGETATEVLGIDRQKILRLAHLDGGPVMLSWLQTEHRQVKDEVLLWLEKEGITRNEAGFILDRMSLEQIRNYIIRERGAHTVRHVLETWKDYLSMAGRLGLDVNDEIIYRTKNLFARHDEAVEEFARRKDAIEAEEFERKYGGITMACARIRDKFDYTGEKYCVVTPHGAQDIIEDSRQLHHCAGSSDRYYERIEQDETYILFLRRTESPDESYYTLEVEPDGTTRQKRSAYNRQPDLQEINAFLREWQAVVKKRLKEADKEAARLSAAKRAEEMAALASSGRQRDIDLYTALSNDLLAASY